MGTFYFYLTIIIAMDVTKSMKSFEHMESIVDKRYQHCVCVPYWQCKDDYSELIEDGIDVMDIRFGPNDEEANSCTGDFDVCCQVGCGRSRSINSDIAAKRILDDEVFRYRVLGDNNEAAFAEFPWMLGILEDKTYRCGASLIHPRVALTAAHCVTSKGPFNIRAGEWNWVEKTEPFPHQDRTVKEIIIHPGYHAPSLRNDIALLILDSPFKLTENVGIVCLPLQERQIDLNRCIATGWGKNSYKKGNYQTILKKVELPIVPADTCVKLLQRARLGPLFVLHKSFICAGGEVNKDTCKGDGGSPLMCPVTGEPGRYEQVGIVSWGLTCGTQNTPGVYVNVGLFKYWIESIMEVLDLDTKFYTN